MGRLLSIVKRFLPFKTSSSPPPRIKSRSRRKKPFSLSLGTRGEMAGWAFLRNSGYTIKVRNYRCPIGEIDVIAEKDGRLIFIEIKTRSQTQYGSPFEAVHEAKQRKLVRVAQWYLKESRQTTRSASFAVLGIVWHHDRDPDCRLIENAFSVDNDIN